MKKAKDLHAQWAKDPKYRVEYDSLEAEFDLASALISARSSAGLSQQQVADRMETSQSFVARLEGGVVIPTWTSLQRYAKATGSRLKIELIPELGMNPKSNVQKPKRPFSGTLTTVKGNQKHFVSRDSEGHFRVAGDNKERTARVKDKANNSSFETSTK